MRRKKQKQDQKRIEEIYALFNEYMDLYAQEWMRLERCEKLYHGQHWEEMQGVDEREPKPVTPVIFSTVESIRADLSEMIPEAVITADDPRYVEVAATLTEVVRENHKRSHFDREYHRMLHDLLVGGMMVLEVGFDPYAAGGVGGAFLKHVDSRSIMFDPYCTDIQDSRAIFKFKPHRREWYFKYYPDYADMMISDGYTHDKTRDAFASLDQSDTIMLIECWERKFNAKTGKHEVHMCKLAGSVMLEDSSVSKSYGYFEHGFYPFVASALYERKGTYLGYGIADMFENRQLVADKLDQIVLKNALMASHNKLLITGASGFDANDLRDWSKEVHEGDSLSGISWFSTAPLPSYVFEYMESVRSSIKEESGSNDISRGSVAAGVTAASAIAALQEMASKRSRLAQRSIYAAFCEAVQLEINIEREFSILPKLSELKLSRIPTEMQVSVKVQHANAFSTISHNELILSLVQHGIIKQDVALDLMIFEGKEHAISLMKEYTNKSTAAN